MAAEAHMATAATETTVKENCILLDEFVESVQREELLARRTESEKGWG